MGNKAKNKFNTYLHFISIFNSKLIFFIFLNIISFSINQEKTQNIACSNVPFCQRLMFYKEDQTPLYYLDNKTITISGDNPDNNNILKAILKNYNKEFLSNAIDLELTVYILKRGIFRAKIKPINEKGNKKRFELNKEDDIFNMKDTIKKSNIKISKGDKNIVIYYFSKKSKIKYELLINLSPFQLIYKMDNNILYHINSKNLFEFEKPDKDFVSTEQDSMTTLKMDMLIPNSIILTGLPERCGSSLLVDTDNISQNGYYHFYNIDVFKFGYNQYNAIYGSIPYIMTYSYGGNIISGFYWNNPSETFISLKTDIDGKKLVFLSEGGIFDISFFGSLNIEHYYKTLKEYIGETPIPNIFSIGYHQSRFSYEDFEDSKAIDQKFDEYNIPYDSIWLDIDHTDSKKYFTYDLKKYPAEHMKNFFNELDKKGRKAVVILDPHIKVDSWYPVYYNAKNKYFIKKDNQNDFIGQCWCGDSSFLDFYNKDVANYWKKLILKNDDYFFDSKNIHIWNDMNEPSVFKISRNTVPKNSIIKYDKINYEHREAHNLYGYLMHKATYEALLQKYKNKIRPFILTRSFYIGSHKYSAMWTGDTKSNFDDLKNAIPMMISLSLSGYSFVGCDVGGFAEEGNINLYIRWYQNGVFYPFFRGHSHESTLRREIWLYSEEDFLNIRNSILQRYTIIPYIYTQFYLHYKTGIPIIKPVWFYDKSELALTEFADNEYFFGNSILVRPVLSSNEDLSNMITVYLPENERWYDFYDYKEVKKNKKIDYQINPNKIGAFIKGGEIIQKKMRLRRSTQKMKNDPLTLVISLDLQNQSKGVLYFDDEESFEYQKEKYSLLEIKYNQNNSKEIEFVWKKYNYDVINNIEKIVIIGENELNNQNANAELIMNNNNKFNLEMKKDLENNLIEIIRINKYKLTDIKRIKLA